MTQSLDVFLIYTHTLVISLSLMTLNTIDMQQKHVSKPDFFSKEKRQPHPLQMHMYIELPTWHQLLDF